MPKHELCQDCWEISSEDPTSPWAIISDEPHFGKWPCEECGEPLAGHRFDAVLKEE